MRKTNPFLRAAILLLALTMATVGAVMSTNTLGKYVAAGLGTSEARIAKFSFAVGSWKTENPTDKYAPYNFGGTPYNGIFGSGAMGPRYWEQIVTPTGIGTNSIQTITVPMFSNAYQHNSTTALGNTVQSSDDALVIAPGIGHHVDAAVGNPNYSFGASNPNYPGLASDGGGTDLMFYNNSEVTIRYKVEYDSFSLPYSIPYETKTFKSGTEAYPDWTYLPTVWQYTIPFFFGSSPRLGASASPDCYTYPFNYAWFRTDNAVHLTNQYVNGDGLGDEYRYIPVTYNGNGDYPSPWRVLAPGESELKQICWIWCYQLLYNAANQPIADGTDGTVWSATVDLANYPPDEFDTWLGMAAAGKKFGDGSNPNMYAWQYTDQATGAGYWAWVDLDTGFELKFRITVEQVD